MEVRWRPKFLTSPSAVQLVIRKAGRAQIAPAYWLGSQKNCTVNLNTPPAGGASEKSRGSPLTLCGSADLQGKPYEPYDFPRLSWLQRKTTEVLLALRSSKAFEKAAGDLIAPTDQLAWGKPEWLKTAKKIQLLL